MKLVDLLNTMDVADSINLVGFGAKCCVDFIKHYVIENVQNAEVKSIQSADNYIDVQLTDEYISGLHDD